MTPNMYGICISRQYAKKDTTNSCIQLWTYRFWRSEIIFLKILVSYHRRVGQIFNVRPIHTTSHFKMGEMSFFSLVICLVAEPCLKYWRKLLFGKPRLMRLEPAILDHKWNVFGFFLLDSFGIINYRFVGFINCFFGKFGQFVMGFECKCF